MKPRALIINLGLFLILNQAVAQDLNVFIGFEDEDLKNHIQKFNECLEQSSILTRYQIEPFIKHHPLHITLYLSSFAPENWPKVLEKTRLLSQQWATFDITTAHVNLTPSNYLMLDIEFKTEYGPQPMLQRLSDATVLQLHNDRDFSATIPPWASSIPVKKKAFAHYGSPNVFFELNPHFTLFAKVFKDPSVEKQFQLDMESALNTCTIPSLTLKAKFIGVGEVDEFGQITNQLAQFPLKATAE